MISLFLCARRVFSLILGTTVLAISVAHASLSVAAEEGSSDRNEPDPKYPIRVTLLGTGTPAPNPRQFGPSVLVEANGTKLLFDCGRGCAHQLWNIGHDKLRNTSHLFLTHLHSDHTIGVADLYMNGWNLGRKEHLQVFGPAAAQDLMDHLRMAYEEDVVIRADKQTHVVTRETLGHSVTAVKDRDELNIGGVSIKTIAVDHHVVEPAFGYRVEFAGYSVVISGDTAYSNNLVEASKGADVLIHEVMSPALEFFVRKTFPEPVAEDIVALHTLAPDVGRVFSQAGVRLGVLTHLDNDPKFQPELRRQIRTTWRGDLEVGMDMMVIEIGEDIRVSTPDP